MDPDLRAKLDDLLGKQVSLRNELSKLGSRCAILDEEIGRLANELSTAETETAEDLDQLKKVIDQEREKIGSATPPPLPPKVKQVVKEAPKAVKQPDPEPRFWMSSHGRTRTAFPMLSRWRQEPCR